MKNAQKIIRSFPDLQRREENDTSVFPFFSKIFSFGLLTNRSKYGIIKSQKERPWLFREEYQTVSKK